MQRIRRPSSRCCGGHPHRKALPWPHSPLRLQHASVAVPARRSSGRFVPAVSTSTPSITWIPTNSPRRATSTRQLRTSRTLQPRSRSKRSAVGDRRDCCAPCSRRWSGSRRWWQHCTRRCSICARSALAASRCHQGESRSRAARSVSGRQPRRSSRAPESLCRRSHPMTRRNSSWGASVRASTEYSTTGQTLLCRFCRKFSFEAICGMVSPSNPCCQGGERRWRSASKGLISLQTLYLLYLST